MVAKSKRGVRKVKEIRLLEHGFVPKQTKIGTEFKGKNKIIIGK